MKIPKKQIALRLSEHTLQELAEIAKEKGVSQADVVTVLVHLFYSGESFDKAQEVFNIAKKI
jgi:hypothetical protein